MLITKSSIKNKKIKNNNTIILDIYNYIYI